MPFLVGEMDFQKERAAWRNSNFHLSGGREDHINLEENDSLWAGVVI